MITLPTGFEKYIPFLKALLERIQGIMKSSEGEKYNSLSLFVLVRELGLEDKETSQYIGGILVVLSSLSLGFWEKNPVLASEAVSRTLEEAWFPIDSRNAMANRGLLKYLLEKISEV